ncbi:MAG: CvpA family protein [Thermoguttaceae bacterium]|nr:CvpA family protein [Thermoguttaceae bacterium]
MSALFSLLLLLIFAAVVAFSYTEGLWGNVIRLINVVTAALLAVNFFEPAGRWVEGLAEQAAPYADFLSLWILFLIFYSILRVITDRFSRHKVRFMMIVDRIGSGFFACWTAWVIVCFATMSMHTAPLARNFMFGGFKPGESMFFGVAAPDMQWLAFTQTVSRQAFSRTVSEGEYGYDADRPSESKLAVFDRQAVFIPKYAAFRSIVESKGAIPKR